MKPLQRIASWTMLIAISSITFYACKKTSTTELETKEQQELLTQVKKKLKNEPLTSKVVVNLPGKGYYGDVSGNRISVVPGRGAQTESTCPDPGLSEFSQELVSITSEFTCFTGYRFVVQYKIVSEFYPQLTNGGSLFSRGRIKLVNGSGTQVYITPTTTINPVISIENNGVVGQNSNGDDLYEFLVSYRSEIIDEATYNLSAAVQGNLICFTDCSNYPTLNIGFSTQQQVLGSQQNSQPCLRIDKVHIFPRNGTTPPVVAGASVTPSTCYPIGWVFPHKQEIQFFSGDGVWRPFFLYAPGGPPLEKSLINYWDLLYIDVSKSQTTNGLVPGNVQIRYRNNQMGTTSDGGPCVTQPGNTWIVETWLIN